MSTTQGNRISKHAQNSRRDFLRNVGSGMLIAGVGASVASEIGCSSTFAFSGPSSYGDPDSLSFGKLNPLVEMMQELSPEQLQEKLVQQLRSNEVDLRQMIAAAALANAETFGGQDYVGYHAEMALIPALEMSAELAPDRQALPVLKVLYRNTEQIQKVGGAKKKTLHQPPVAKAMEGNMGQKIRAASRKRDMQQAEQLFASINNVPLLEKFDAILPVIKDDINVHRFVLAHRSLQLVDIVGEEHAHTMLRQCVRYCVDEEQIMHRRRRQPSAIRTLLPRLINQYKLLEIKLGSRDPGEKWIEDMGNTIYEKNEFQASDAVAAALADGISPDVIAEAISLASNALVLRQGADIWRTHGDSSGVHASDAANAWRNIIKVVEPANIVGGLICSAFHTARYQPFMNDPYPSEAHRLKVKVNNADELLGLAEECIRSNDQATAAAAIQVYGERQFDVRPVFDLMLKYAISEDGRLHSEKYYRTVYQEYVTMRKSLRWRQLVALARVTASAYSYDRNDSKGNRAAGYEDACKLLQIDV